MSARLALLGVLALGLAGCRESRAARAPTPHSFALDLARVPTAYAFEGRARVPWTDTAPPGELSFGELGRTPATGLYLSFEGELARALAAQPAGWSVSASGLASAPGRFARGARLGPTAELRCQLAPEARTAAAWTVEMWVRPEEGAQGELLALPGLFRAWRDGRGSLRVEMPAGAPDLDAERVPELPLRSAVPLASGEWNHLAVTLDLGCLRALRLVVNGTVQGLALAPAWAAPEPQELLVGASAQGPALACELDELRVQLRSASSDELARSHAARPRALERLRLEYADGTEELELWSSALVGAQLATAADWARGDLTHCFAARDGLRWSAEHWRELDTPDAPPARTAHPLVALGGGRVFTFGGEVRDTHFGLDCNTDETWILDLERASWKRVARAPAPPPRCHVPAAYSPADDLVLLSGGWYNATRPGHILADTWVLHVGEERWEQRRPTGEPPPAGSDQGLVWLPEERVFLLLWAARSWFYDPRADRWERRAPARAQDEQGRALEFELGASPMCARDPATGLILCFGGSSGPGQTRFSDVTALYDVGANAYTVLAARAAPSPRVRSGFAHDARRGRFVLFGGVQDQRSARHADLWTFDPRARQWREVPPGPPRPGPRGGFFGMAYDAERDLFVLPAGREGFERWLQETWVLELDEGAAGRARYLFDRAAYDARGWFAELDEPDGAAVSFRFRTSADGRRFGPWEQSAASAPRFVEVEVTLRPGALGAAPRVRAMGFR